MFSPHRPPSSPHEPTTISVPGSPQSPFRISCRLPPRRRPSAASTDTVYTVEPQRIWNSMKTYKHLVKDDFNFGANDFVFINAGGTGTATTEKNKFGIARVLEIKAHDAEHVYLRVHWWHRPGELPLGCPDYHGSN